MADAAARFKMPPIPSSILSVSHPANAMYSNACPASVALYFVLRPHSLAASVSLFVSSAVAPLNALTLDICASKSAAVFTDAVPIPATAAVTYIAFCPTVCNAPLTFPAFCA